MTAADEARAYLSVIPAPAMFGRALVEQLLAEHDAAIDRAEKAEADYALCFEEWGNSVRTAGERNAELFIRANEAETQAQSTDVLRAQLAAIGELHDEWTIGDEDGPTAVRHFLEGEARHFAAIDGALPLRRLVSEWRPADTIPSRADVEQQAGHVHTKWAGVKATRMDSPVEVIDAMIAATYETEEQT